MCVFFCEFGVFFFFLEYNILHEDSINVWGIKISRIYFLIFLIVSYFFYWDEDYLFSLKANDVKVFMVDVHGIVHTHSLTSKSLRLIFYINMCIYTIVSKSEDSVKIMNPGLILTPYRLRERESKTEKILFCIPNQAMLSVEKGER